MTAKGVIYLVGAGPGELGLITVKGLALVREADALVGDMMTYARLLQEARPDAERYDIGSLHRGNKTPQEEITGLLLELARQGKTVVRLWAGDPFVFGRAAEEMSQAKRAGIRVEPVPGVTSAVAAPAYAGVPVTDWRYANSFAVVTGFEPDHSGGRVNWPALAGAETLVILMPLQHLPETVTRLLAAGRPPDTPALAIQHGTLPHQKQVRTRLDRLVEQIKAHGIQHPAVIVVGQVVKLAGELAWFSPRDYPLLGQRVLVTRPGHQAAEMVAALRAMGAEPISFPTIEIRPVEDTGPLDKAINRLKTAVKPGMPAAGGLMETPYDWLVLTSANGVNAFWDRLKSARLDSRCLATLRIAAIGPATAAALQERSITPDLVPEVYTAEGVLAAFDDLESVAGQRFLLARADIARKALAEGLVERGAYVDEIAAYRTVPVEGNSPPPAAEIVTFTSSSTVQGYVNCLADRSPAEALRDSRVICIGPITAATAEELGLPVSAVAEAYTMDGMLETLQRLYM